jgi:hypothetical protein
MCVHVYTSIYRYVHMYMYTYIYALHVLHTQLGTCWGTPVLTAINTHKAMNPRTVNSLNKISMTGLEKGEQWCSTACAIFSKSIVIRTIMANMIVMVLRARSVSPSACIVSLRFSRYCSRKAASRSALRLRCMRSAWFGCASAKADLFCYVCVCVCVCVAYLMFSSKSKKIVRVATRCVLCVCAFF